MRTTEGTTMIECMTVSGDVEISVKTAMIKGKVFLAIEDEVIVLTDEQAEKLAKMLICAARASNRP
jgi:hypothetical protein